MLFIVLIGLIVIAFAAFIYKQDETDFTKLTNYSFFDLLLNKEARKLNRMYKSMQRVDGEYRILLNVHIQEGVNVHKIPAILLHESGIHVLSTVDIDGWVIGSDRSIEWVNLLYKKDKKTFENPVLVNRRYIYAMRELMAELPEGVFQSVVVFNDGCSFQKVEVSSNHVEVLKTKELSRWADSLVGQALSPEDIEKLYDALKDKMEFQKKVVMKNVKREKQAAI
ncbi:MAG: nuclease-related domain-containing protein [Lysinibacillus sp.]